MNADGFALMDRLQSDPELLNTIDRCAWYARIDKQVELIMFRSQLKGDKTYPEPLLVHLLSRLLENLT